VVRPNRVKALLREGRPAIGAWVNYTSLVAVEMLAYLGFDWLLVDGQHGVQDLETMQAMFVAIGSTPTIPFARVAGNDPLVVGRVLDAGAYGIMMPNVDTADQAQAAVRACFYAPLGARSAGLTRLHYWAGEDYIARANDEILLMVQIESAEALRNVDAILGVRGVEACYIGPYDLALSMGVDLASPAHEEAIARILAAARARGVAAGIWCNDAAEAARRLDQGFRLVNLGGEMGFMIGAARREIAAIRTHLDGPRR